MKISRYLTETIKKDALQKNKIAIISGPRQVGKSTLAKSLLKVTENYFLYDDEKFRRAWSKDPENAISSRGEGVIVLDEVHKDRTWKRKLKGIYDKQSSDLKIVVTGSARLDIFRKGSDSLLGRYFPYRLFPFTVAETSGPIKPGEFLTQPKITFNWQDLLMYSGFPEPLLDASEARAKRWSRLRLDRLVNEDSRDVRNISDLNAFRNLTNLLSTQVGSLSSVHSVAEDVGKAYATVRDWVQILEALYFCFRIAPYSKRVNRGVKAAPKLYLFDILQIPSENMGQRQENLVALHLYKACAFWTDAGFGEFELRFVRDKEKREVDFLLLKEGQPWILIECKSRKTELSPFLLYFSAMLKPEHSFQLVSEQDYDRYYAQHKIRVIGYQKFMSGLL